MPARSVLLVSLKPNVTTTGTATDIALVPPPAECRAGETSWLRCFNHAVTCRVRIWLHLTRNCLFVKMRHALAAGTRRGVTAERVTATVARIMTKVMVSGIGMASEIRASGRESETETGIKAEKGEATGTVIKMQNSADISTSTGTATDIALVPPPAHPPRARGKLQPCFCSASHSQGNCGSLGVLFTLVVFVLTCPWVSRASKYWQRVLKTQRSEE